MISEWPLCPSLSRREERDSVCYCSWHGRCEWTAAGNRDVLSVTSLIYRSNYFRHSVAGLFQLLGNRIKKKVKVNHHDAILG